MEFIDLEEVTHLILGAKGWVPSTQAGVGWYLFIYLFIDIP